MMSIVAKYLIVCNEKDWPPHRYRYEAVYHDERIVISKLDGHYVLISQLTNRCHEIVGTVVDECEADLYQALKSCNDLNIIDLTLNS